MLRFFYVANTFPIHRNIFSFVNNKSLDLMMRLN
jgi:hypothetical protein